MYYEEKLIDGVLHYRMLPKGEWTKMTDADLTIKLIATRQQLNALKAIIREGDNHD
jgi:hypothetical protein